MEKAVKLEALTRLNNSKLNVLKEIAERTENGAKFIHFTELGNELECSRHVIHDAVHGLIEAGLVIVIPGDKTTGTPGKLKIAPGVIVDCTG